MFASVEMDFWD